MSCSRTRDGHRPKRSRDDGRSLAAFIEHVDVVCPRCNCHAHVSMLEWRKPDTVAAFPARLTCDHCGLVRTQQLGRDMWSYILRADGGDPHFGVPLWLQTRTRHGLLVAYNVQHLEALEAFIGATLRERCQDPGAGWRNKTMASRLPRWMKVAHNREEMRAALERLRARLSR